jgi:hypothetical protein
VFLNPSKNHIQILKEKRKSSQALLGAKTNLNLILVHFSIEKNNIFIARHCAIDVFAFSLVVACNNRYLAHVNKHP